MAFPVLPRRRRYAAGGEVSKSTTSGSRPHERMKATSSCGASQTLSVCRSGWKFNCASPISEASITTVTTPPRSEEHTSELQSLMRNSYDVFCLTKKKHNNKHHK